VRKEERSVIRFGGETLTKNKLRSSPSTTRTAVAEGNGPQFETAAIEVASQYLSGTMALRDCGVVVQDSTMDPKDAPLRRLRVRSTQLHGGW